MAAAADLHLVAMPPPSSPTSPTNSAEAIEFYRGYGLRSTPVRPGEKAGYKSGWSKPGHSCTAKDFKLDDNIGIINGTQPNGPEYASYYFHDVDIDANSDAARLIVERLLPETGWRYGHASKPRSHANYLVRGQLRSRRYAGADGKVTLELRGITKKGTHTLSVAPGSTHSSGESIRFCEPRGNIGIVEKPEDLDVAVQQAAVGIVIAQVWPATGRHNLRLAFPKVLRAHGLTSEQCRAILEAVMVATGSNVEDVGDCIQSTEQALAAGQPAAGASLVREVLGDDQANSVLQAIARILGSVVSEFICKPGSLQPIADNYENLQRALAKLDAQLSFNEFSQVVQASWNDSTGPLDDAVRNRLWFEIERRCGFRSTTNYFDVFLQDVAHQQRFHPVRDYFDGLTWDGISRIDTWLTTYGGAADNPYTRAVGALLLLAAVKRIQHPGCKFDEMLVLESEQGRGKSTMLRTLCPNDDWFSDDLPLNVDAKQIIERTLGKWIIEASDLHGYKSADVEHLKSMLSRSVDGPVRLAYARMPTQRHRHFVVVGTTNSHVYLKDATGNRRFWPVRVQHFNIPGLRSVRDQLWAEAVKRVGAGESIRLDPALYSLAELQQERRRQIDPWEAKLEDVYPRDEQQRLTWDEIYAAVGLSIDRRDPQKHARLVKILQQLGFRSFPIKRDGKVVRGMGRDAVQGDLPIDDAGCVL
ncbi:MAG TPA: virulence-associated E family protein [Vicinamibacterales bacterium]|nr:virulence-associated E family protein [Vicinamibacterales bacterium]